VRNGTALKAKATHIARGRWNILVRSVCGLFVQELEIGPDLLWILFWLAVMATMVWRTWPSSSLWVIGTLVGVSMLFSGITRLMLSFAARRTVSRDCQCGTDPSRT
jgi:uncharacterized membrane protein HdeD (DUF308 family)